MKITETALRPNPNFGWATYSRTRELAAGETMPSGAVAAADDAAVTDWTPVAPTPTNFPGAVTDAQANKGVS